MPLPQELAAIWGRIDGWGTVIMSAPHRHRGPHRNPCRRCFRHPEVL